MSERFEYYITGDNIQVDIYGTKWQAQTFTPSVPHTVTSVKLKLFRIGSPSGNLAVGIRATSAGEPTGEDLCSGAIACSSLSTNTAGVWTEITLGAGTDLDASTMYAIVVRAVDASTEEVFWRRDSAGATYAGGTHCESLNGGSSWSIISGADLMFEEWGEEIVVGWTGKISGVTNPAKIMGVDVANIKSVKGVE